MKEKTLINPGHIRPKGFFRRLRTMFADEERRAYLVLAAFMVVLTLVAGTFTIVQNNILEHKFCQLIDASIQTPVPKPTDPKANPSREQNYEDYVIISALDRNLGCTGAKNSGG